MRINTNKMNISKQRFKINVIAICYLLAIITILLGTFTSCNKYMVMSCINTNLYHLHNVKTKESEIILSNDTLILGKHYKLKEINIIESPYYK